MTVHACCGSSEALALATIATLVAVVVLVLLTPSFLNLFVLVKGIIGTFLTVACHPSVHSSSVRSWMLCGVRWISSPVSSRTMNTRVRIDAKRLIVPTPRLVTLVAENLTLSPTWMTQPLSDPE